MRVAVVLFVSVAVFGAGCEKEKLDNPLPSLPAPPGVSAGAARPLSSSVAMGDLRAAHHLREGFYSVEDSAWRWTAKRFSVELGLPPGAREKGARLRVEL